MKKLSSLEQVELVFSMLVALHEKQWASLDSTFFSGLIQNIIICRYGYDDYDEIGNSQFKYVREAFVSANKCIQEYGDLWNLKREELNRVVMVMLSDMGFNRDSRLGFDSYGNGLN